MTLSKQIRTALAALFIGFVPVAALAEAPAPSPLAAAVDTATPEPMMWVIRDADSTLYLFGTIHVMAPDVDWMTPAVKERFDASGELWLEIADMDDVGAMAAAMMPHMFDPSGDMTQGLTEDDLALLDRHLTRHGMKRSDVKPFRKWMVGLLLAQADFTALGMTPESGVDMTLLRQARAAEKPVRGFETVAEQLAFLIPKTPDEEIAGLRLALSELDRGPQVALDLVAAWVKGDEDALARLLLDEMKLKDPAGYDRLLVQRNRNWVPKIETLLAGEGTVFIAVGGAHLVGPDSVIAMLRDKGVTVEVIDTAP